MSVVRLSNDDCCAVDLILERNQTGPEGITNCYTVAPSADMQQRLTRVEKILHLLDAHTSAEPTSDLLSRTLARCDQRAAVAGTMPAPAPSASTPAR
jgi:hypothetical protein